MKHAEYYQGSVKQAEKNKITRQKIIDEYNRRNKEYDAQVKKIESTLSKLYNMNIVPVQYRNIAAICYIYDYMSSSRLSLENALFSQQIDDGIRRIEQKLDTIVMRLEDIIYKLNVIHDDNQASIKRQEKQNISMLHHLQSIESNTDDIRTYSELITNYTQAQALIQMATYLKQG